jgi:hypothetical protein
VRCSHYHLLRYEELFDESHSGLRRLCALLGLEYRGAGAPVDPSQHLNRGRLDVLSGWRDWSPEQCATLDRICAPLMGEYGYGTESEWRNRVASFEAGDNS